MVTVDLPGHCLTGPDPEARYQPHELAAFVDHFTAAIGLARFSLAGSMGGGIAWRYALLHPDKVERLILVDAAGYPQPPPGMLRLMGMPFVGRVARWLTPRFAVARSVHEVYGDPSRVNDEIIDRYRDLLLRDGNREATRDRLTNRRDDGMLARLHELRVPTLILWGSRDAWIPPANGPRFAADIPGARLEMLEGLGHVPMEEDPARSLAPVLGFLSLPSSGK